MSGRSERARSSHGAGGAGGGIGRRGPSGGRRLAFATLALLRFVWLFAVAATLLAQEPGSVAPSPPGAAESSKGALARLHDIEAEAAGPPSLRRTLTVGALLAVATFVTEDLTCLGAGLLVAHGHLSFLAATVACCLGIFVGDLALVAVGRLFGEGAIRRRPLSRWVSPEVLARSERWFLEKGARVVFLSRFVPGSRLPLFLAAGVLRAPLLPIAGALALAGVVWTPALVGLSAWTGGRALALVERYEKLAIPAVALAALAVWLVVKVVVPLFSWRGRRLLLSRWRRITRWEFWPAWLFQAPVVLHVLRLGAKHGGLGTFAAANPGIPAGGFVEESKSAILDALGDAPVARFAVIDLEGGADAGEIRAEADAGAQAATRLAAADAAFRSVGLDFPLVMKPDVGERGAGVAVVRDPLELAARLENARGRWILQEYVAGEEFGVFWVRSPDAERGSIFSITGKRFPVVVGDGERRLDELILADDRAVCMAAYYLEVNAARADSVPAAGEIVQLVEIGNHCRGTVFLDAREHATEALHEAIGRIAAGFPGFHFGRFDLRAPSVEAFRAGEGLRILELNGVTSEATHIYAPGASLVAGWRTLFEQWRLAFSIGAANLERGARRTTARELVSLLRRRRRRSATMPPVSNAPGA